ncbi:MAG TPA: RNA polymerase-binding protein DksA [Steroidobacteraceae bacterium]|nr:RNA polymerase-binding protein DksA [Steroidobacteraceae bacterium]
MPTKKSAKASKAKKTVSAKKAAAKPVRKAAAKPASKSVKPMKPAGKAAPKPEAKKTFVAPTKVPITPAAKAASKGSAAPAAAPQIPSKAPSKMPVRPALSPPSAKNVAIAERRRPLPTASAGDSDEPDFEGSSNLLAGPRNVTPYQAKRGEQYMNKEQLEHFRNILQTWKHDLMEEVDRTVLHMKDEAANFPDPNDRATQESEFSLELRTRDRERKLIRKIDDAISRIEDGSYGYCVETGEEIGIKRLEARPVATLCVEAQERRERRERQYGDRDDRYR